MARPPSVPPKKDWGHLAAQERLEAVREAWKRPEERPQVCAERGIEPEALAEWELKARDGALWGLRGGRERERRVRFLAFVSALGVAGALLMAMLSIRPDVTGLGPIIIAGTLPLFAALVVVGVGAVVLLHHGDVVQATTEDIRTELESSLRSSQDLLRRHLEQTVQLIEGRPDVTLEATRLLGEVFRLPESERKVRYIGAPSLTTLIVNLADEELPDSPARKYKEAQERLRKERVDINRFVCFLDPDDFVGRKPETQESYLRWIEKQIDETRNEEYHLYFSPRAPKWGDAQSTILTPFAVLDVTGGGNSARLMRGERISGRIETDLEALFRGAKRLQRWKAAELRKHLEELRAAQGAAARKEELTPGGKPEGPS